MTAARPFAGLVVVEAMDGAAPRALRLAAAMAGRLFAGLGAEVVAPADAGGDIHTNGFLSIGKTLVGDAGRDNGAIEEALRRADAAIYERRQAGVPLPHIVARLSIGGGQAAEQPVPASEFTASAMAGLLHMVGDPDRAPLKLGGHQEAYALGLAVFCGLAAALAGGGRDAAPSILDASLVDTLVWLNWKAVPLGKPDANLPGREGRAAEWQTVRCKDGFIALVYQEPDWPRLCAAVADDRLQDARFASRAQRLVHAGELAAIVEQRFSGMTRREVQALALAHRLPLGPVWSPQEAFEDPHNLARNIFQTVSVGKTAQALLPRLPVHWNHAEPAPHEMTANQTERSAAS